MNSALIASFVKVYFEYEMFTFKLLIQIFNLYLLLKERIYIQWKKKSISLQL